MPAPPKGRGWTETCRCGPPRPDVISPHVGRATPRSRRPSLPRGSIRLQGRRVGLPPSAIARSDTGVLRWPARRPARGGRRDRRRLPWRRARSGPGSSAFAGRPTVASRARPALSRPRGGGRRVSATRRIRRVPEPHTARIVVHDEHLLLPGTEPAWWALHAADPRSRPASPSRATPLPLRCDVTPGEAQSGGWPGPTSKARAKRRTKRSRPGRL